MANDTDLRQSERESPGAGFDVDALHSMQASPPRFGRLALCVAAASALAFGVLGTVAYGVWFNHDQRAYAEAIAGARQALGVPASAATAAGGRLAKPVGAMRPAVSVATPEAVATTPATASAVPATGVTTASAAAATSSVPAAITPASAQTANASPSPESALVSAGEEGSKQAVWSGRVGQSAAAASSQTTLADATPPSPAPSSRSTRRAANSPNSADPATQQSASRSAKDTRIAQQGRRASSANAKHKSGLFARMGLFFRRVNYRQHDSERRQQDLYSHP